MSTPAYRVVAPDFDGFFRTQRPADLYSKVKESIEQHFMLNGAFMAIGASQVFFTVPLRANETTAVEFKDHGVPVGSLVLDMNLTGQGGPMPIQWQINDSQQRFSDLGMAHIFGACPNADRPREGSVAVAITWIAPPEDETSLRHLIDAATFYSNAIALSTQGLENAGHFDRVIVPANIAVESAIGRALFRFIESFASNEKAADFLKNAATYGHQLKILLPIVTHMTGAPALSDDIRGALGRLLTLRNEIGHGGKPKKVAITRAVAAEMFTAALFGYRYAGLLGAEIEKAKREGRLPTRAVREDR